MLSPRPGCSKAFTLIELIVSVLIISLLAALLTAGLSRIVRQSYKASCASNLRQIGTVIQLYCQDHDGYFPGPLSGSQPGYFTPTARGVLLNYIEPYLAIPAPTGTQPQRVELLICPGWKRALPNGADTDVTAGSYALRVNQLWSPNGTAFGMPQQVKTDDVQPEKVSALYKPSKTIAIWDRDTLSVGKSGPTIPAGPVHNGQRNYLFFDWHVESGTFPPGP